jgi:uncharacterized protein YjeT (DUF2065 family)
VPADLVGEHAVDASRSQRIVLLVEGLVIGAHPRVAQSRHTHMSQKSTQSLRMGHYFSDGLLGLAILGKRLTSLGALLASRYLGFGTLLGAIRKPGEHRDRVRCTPQVRGVIWIGWDRS